MYLEDGEVARVLIVMIIFSCVRASHYHNKVYIETMLVLIILIILVQQLILQVLVLQVLRMVIIISIMILKLRFHAKV